MEDAGGTLEQAVERAGTDGVANAARLAELTGEEAALPKRQRGPRQSTVAPFSVRECSHVYLATARPFLGTWGGAGRRLARQRGARDAGGRFGSGRGEWRAAGGDRFARAWRGSLNVNVVCWLISV